MHTAHVTDRHNTATTDLTIYGIYAPHFRYRQERIVEAALAASMNHRDHDHPGSRSHFGAMRERIGTALIAWGTRLEGQRQGSSPTPAPAPLR